MLLRRGSLVKDPKTQDSVQLNGGILARAEGPWSDLALHSIGWKAFQDLCFQVCEEVLHCPVEVFREAQDGGQDAGFLILPKPTEPSLGGTIQCKHSSDPGKRLKPGDLTSELTNISELVEKGLAHTYILMTSLRGQSLTRGSAAGSKLSFGGSFGRADRGFGR